MKALTFIIFSLMVLPFTSSGWAAPFCVASQSLPLQCQYYDIKVCLQDAEKIKAQCKVNPEEVDLEASNGRFCLIKSYGAPDCIYSDFSSCNKNNTNRDGLCQDSRPVPDFAEANIPTQEDDYAQQQEPEGAIIPRKSIDHDPSANPQNLIILEMEDDFNAKEYPQQQNLDIE